MTFREEKGGTCGEMAQGGGTCSVRKVRSVDDPFGHLISFTSAYLFVKTYQEYTVSLELAAARYSGLNLGPAIFWLCEPWASHLTLD